MEGWTVWANNRPVKHAIALGAYAVPEERNKTVRVL